MKRALLLLSLCFSSLAIYAQTTVSGTVTDESNGDPLISATVALYKEGNLISGNITDFDGNYYFSNVDAGSYDLEVTYTGYQSQRIAGVQVLAGRSNVVDVQLSEGIVLTGVEVIGYKKPLVEQDNTTQGGVVTSDEIRQLPTRSINALAATAPGVATTDEGSALSIRGSRSNATYYYVDGIRVQGALPQESEIEQLQTVIGGVPSQYGDVTGGFLSITTKGPSRRFSGSAEIETSEFLDDFGQSLAGFSMAGPILKSADGQRSILGFRLAGRYTVRDEDDPPATPVFRVSEDRLAEMEANPLQLINTGDGRYAPFVAAEFYDNDDVNALTARPYEQSTRADLTAKLDAQITKGIDVQLTGYYNDRENQFTPFSIAGGGRRWGVYNAHNNPTNYRNDYRFNVRLRHRLGEQGTNEAQSGLVQNAFYTLQFGYENNQSETADQHHGDNYFRYGHVANFDVDYVPVFQNVVSSSGLPDSLVHVDYRAVLSGYDRNNSSNPVLANYNNVYGINDRQDGGLYGADYSLTFQPVGDQLTNDVGFEIPQFVEGFIATNGSTQSVFTDAWNIHTNVGQVYNSVGHSDNDIFTFNANAGLEIKPGGGQDNKNRHTIRFGVMYEQRTLRSYSVSPRSLWTLGRQLINQHLAAPDATNPVAGTVTISQEDGGDLFAGEQTYYAPTVVDNAGQFYQSVRERLGYNLNEYVNIDGLNPDDLSLDMFSAEELNNAGLVGYVGYDYLGNEFNGSFADFFGQVDPGTGQRGANTFSVAPFQPIYSAAYLEDKFTLNEKIFRLGVRIDRYDANTQVLTDPYSLYRLQGAGDFHNNNGSERPGAIGEDFAVYLRSADNDDVVAYRNGDDWFQADGMPVNGPTEIDGIRSGLVFPAYANPLANSEANFIKDERFQIEDSFKDYEVQVNVMPRLSFSFPISDASNFFAHYDVLVQRPASNSFASARTYYYFVDRAGSTTFNNPNLRPTTTIDYEVGFQQRLSNSSALKISAYYKELRDMIQQRTYFPVPLVGQYTTYDNQDFGTTKGFNITYDLRRTKNVQINANYSLAFADGTGSDANSQRGLTNRGNIRTLFPLSFDERHRINLIVDYRLDNEAAGIFKNSGINLQSVAVSGRPYTQRQVPSQFEGSGTIGSINGARKPWTFVMNLRIDKQIKLTDRLGMNVYFRVSNLLDRRNVINVYSVTGSPDDSGWLQSQFGQDFLAQNATRSVPVESFLASYQWALLNPNLYSLPRRMYMGAIINF